jgi:Lrp/AsnC family transcriptional regulator for asnA, asnC and gidA
MRRIRQHLDAVDRQLCELLIEDPRGSNRALAAAVGVTDETVAARLRRLREMNVLGTTVAVDWESAGYGAGAIVRVKLEGLAADDVVDDLSDEGLHFVGKATGCCDLIVAMVARDVGELRTNLSRGLRSRPGLGATTVDVVTETCRYELRNMTLPMQSWSPQDLPSPSPALDDLDAALIELLATDGHESNRALARRLGVSDGTVRARIRRLEDGGLLRVVAGIDPIATGDLRATAMVFVTLDEHGEAVQKLIDSPSVLTAQRCVGRADLVMMLGAPQENSLDTFIVDDLRSVQGVRGVEVAHVVEVLKHRTHLARLVG